MLAARERGSERRGRRGRENQRDRNHQGPKRDSGDNRLGEACKDLPPDHRGERVIDLLEYRVFRFFFERGDLIDELIDSFAVFEEDKSEKEHEKEIKEKEKYILRKSADLGGGITAGVLGEVDQPG